MAIRDEMRESAAGFLQPDEQIQAVISAQTASPWATALFAGGLFDQPLRSLFNRYRIVVATSQRLLVLDAGKWFPDKACGVITELPRSTRLGPASGRWHVIPVTDKKLRVHRQFFKDIEMADSAASLS
jgi:hypothetical protein